MQKMLFSAISSNNETSRDGDGGGFFSEHPPLQIHMEDPKCHVYIRRALRLREQYMADAFQGFPEMTKRALHKNYRSSVRAEKGGKWGIWEEVFL